MISRDLDQPFLKGKDIFDVVLRGFVSILDLLENFLNLFLSRDVNLNTPLIFEVDVSEGSSSCIVH